jgi:F420-dependent oxidoreductase-like protein
VAVRLPEGSLVVLVGPPGSGKSTWAAGLRGGAVVVSSDALCALLGTGPRDQRARGGAFELLDRVVAARLARGLTTVVDATSLEDDRRASYREAARAAGARCVAVAFATPAVTCKARNRARPDPVPDAPMTALCKRAAVVLPGLAGEDFDDIIDATAVEPDDVAIVPARHVDGPVLAARQQEDPMPLAFGLHLSRFDHAGGPAGLGPALVAAAQAAEESGFESLWLMDHLLQIPQVGREWEDIPDSWTALAGLATATSRIRLGVLVTDITLRPLAHLAKVVATVDCLSGGRVTCGIGAGWYAREHEVLGLPFPPRAGRFAVLEDALDVLPRLWGKGAPSFEGRTVTVREATCYPRPVQDPLPILVGGGGEKRTLRLAAGGAAACNVMGEPDVVAHKVAVLRAHCADAGRDPAEVRVTHLSPAQPWDGRGERPTADAATAEELIGRSRALAEVGVQEEYLAPGTLDPDAIRRLAPVVAAFAT